MRALCLFVNELIFIVMFRRPEFHVCLEWMMCIWENGLFCFSLPMRSFEPCLLLLDDGLMQHIQGQSSRVYGAFDARKKPNTWWPTLIHILTWAWLEWAFQFVLGQIGQLCCPLVVPRLELLWMPLLSDVVQSNTSDKWHSLHHRQMAVCSCITTHSHYAMRQHWENRYRHIIIVCFVV